MNEPADDSKGPVIDLTRYHAKRIVGPFIIYSTWFGADLHETEGCLVIIPLRPRGNIRPAVIKMSSAYLYDEKMGDPAHAIINAQTFLMGLGFPVNRKTVTNFVMLIHSCLDDLLTIPPKPSIGSRDVAEATLLDASGKAKTFELIEDI